MNTFQIDQFLESIATDLREQGRIIYKSDAVKAIDFSEYSSSLKTIVESISNYDFDKVTLQRDSLYKYISGNCSCPVYKRDGRHCKHIAAAAYKWKELIENAAARSPASQSGPVWPQISAALGKKTEYTFRISSLENERIRYLVKSDTLKPLYSSDEFKENRSKKSCSLTFYRGHTATARHVAENEIAVSCGCASLNHEYLCSHVYLLLTEIAKRFGVHYFKTYDDYSPKIKETLNRYGLAPDDRAAKEFKFGFGDDGQFTLLKHPENLLPSGEVALWEKKLHDLLPAESGLPDIFDDQSIPLDVTGVGLVLLAGGKHQLPFWIDGVLICKKKAGPSYRKIALKRAEDLAPFAHLPEKTISLIYQLTANNLLRYLADQTGNESMRAQASPWNTLNPAALQILERRYFSILRALANGQTADLSLFLVEPGQTFANDTCHPVTLSLEQPALSFHLWLKDNLLVLSARLQTENAVTNIRESCFYPPFLFRESREVYLIENHLARIVALFKKGDIAVHKNATDPFLQKIVAPLLRNYPFTYGDTLNINTIKITPVPSVYMSERNEKFLVITPKWTYGEYEAEMNGANEFLSSTGGRITRIVRDRLKEQETIDLILGQHPGLKSHFNGGNFILPIDDALHNNWFFHFCATLKNTGHAVYGLTSLYELRYNPHLPSISVKSSSGIDWFDLKIEIHYGDDQVSLNEVRRAILFGQSYIKLRDGSRGIVPDEWLKKYTTLLKFAQHKGDVLKIAKWHYTLLDELEAQIDNQQVLDEINEKKQRLRLIDETDDISLPPNICAQLRDYQAEGFKWMARLDHLGWGGCLADDMGLGKTLQTLTFLLHKINREPALSHLIVCPASLIFNWENEIRKFAPSIRYHIHHGPGKDLVYAEHFDKAAIIITSYGTVRSDIERLSAITFGCVILDESQNIKNPAADVTRSVRLLKAKNRFILSGTPVQNNTFDIFSQMNFLNPGILGSAQFFRNEFAGPIDRGNDPVKSAELKKIISPFLLRRTKQQVAKDLPDKTETILWCEMDTAQRKLYDECKHTYRDQILQHIATDGVAKSTFYIIEGLLKLRQICDSPTLIKNAPQKAGSVKVEELLREFEENTGDHKILCFSQFTSMLQIIGGELEKHHISYLYLDGATPVHKREEVVSRFQNDETERVFLISLKAGGVGLNLTRADYVYLIDPWWNPAAEQQAIDRTHRIGQTNKIFAYKMICKDTVEEKILQLQQKKKLLATDLIAEETGFVKKLTRDDVAFLFS